MKSISKISKTTNAMHLVSAVKMKNARAQLNKALPFFTLCRTTMAEIYLQSPEVVHSFFQRPDKKKGEDLKVAYFVFSGERGLAGAYNINIAKAAQDAIHAHMLEKAKEGINLVPKLYVMGRTGRDFLQKSGFDIEEDYNFMMDTPNFYIARDLADYIHDLYDFTPIEEVYAIYTEVISAIDFVVRVVKLIPISSDDLLEGVDLDEFKKQLPDPSTINMEFFPSSEVVMNYLAYTYLNGMIYGILSESFTSLQIMRRNAMKNATDNAQEILAKLQADKNRVRQGMITEEIIEVVNGANFIGLV